MRFAPFGTGRGTRAAEGPAPGHPLPAKPLTFDVAVLRRQGGAT